MTNQDISGKLANIAFLSVGSNLGNRKKNINLTKYKSVLSKYFQDKKRFLTNESKEKIYYLVPGVKVTASIQIGERTLANYLLSPFIGSMGQSFQER